MSIEEKERIFDEAKALEAKGLIEESERLMNTIPINPELANNFKRVFGIERNRNIKILRLHKNMRNHIFFNTVTFTVTYVI